MFQAHVSEYRKKRTLHIYSILEFPPIRLTQTIFRRCMTQNVNQI